MRGIYHITHSASGKRYIGKSINVLHRLQTHKCYLRKPVRSKKKTNVHLWNAVQRYGWGAFNCGIIEELPNATEEELRDRELYWMDYYNTCSRSHGYNLRRDSSSASVVHQETRERLSKRSAGKSNPNYGNSWSLEMRQRESAAAKLRHSKGGVYGEEWKKKLAANSKKYWSDPNNRRNVSNKIKVIKQKYTFSQLTPEGELVRTWGSMAEIIEENPTFRPPAIYGCCDGYKKTHRGFAWAKEQKRNHT